MNLKQVLEGVSYTILKGDVNTKIKGLKEDSRKVEPDDIFIAISGFQADGHDYIPEAIDKEAKVIIVSKIVPILEDVVVLKVDDTRVALAYMASNYFLNPKDKLIKIGVTGTAGKTTTTFMLRKILEEAGLKVGLIGSNGIFYEDMQIPLPNTTPDAYLVHQYFKEMVDHNIQYVIMEASSQAFKMDRLLGITFDYGVLTNITSDHISPNEHQSQEEYIACKNKLFLNSKVIVVNQDSSYLEEVLKGVNHRVYTYGILKEADLKVQKLELINNEKFLGSHFLTEGLVNHNFQLAIPGKFNVYNALAAITVAKLLKIEDEMIERGLFQTIVKGRMELALVNKKFKVLIDYAHTEDEILNLAQTLKAYHPTRLVSIYGGGGNRASKRRYSLGKVIGEVSDLSIITMDNPRFEDLRKINEDIKEGLNEVGAKYLEIDDREEAIRYVIRNASCGDLILLLGKGHEEYQDIKGVKYPFSEHKILEEIEKTLVI